MKLEANPSVIFYRPTRAARWLLQKLACRARAAVRYESPIPPEGVSDHCDFRLHLANEVQSVLQKRIDGNDGSQFILQGRRSSMLSALACFATSLKLRRHDC